ncbi:VOC family protein [Agromyces humatus]|uniref:Glyoxalase/bleomycin resistance/dioxygenase family protein n=1 Tax=Agromyces humatus TaxID=279573 RepID=A0ABN2K684_9MICO|nr:VOC family protein [Agromyces humatus]
MFEKMQCYGVLPASDLERAVKWWKDVFGLEPDMTNEGGVMFQFGGTPVLVYETQFAGTAKNTAFGIDTEDFDGDAAALRERGVTFLDYDLPGLKTVDGVADLGGIRTAWFNDSEGNIIAIGQRP